MSAYYILKILKMVDERWPFKAVCCRAGLVHSGGHSRWSAGEHPDLWQDDMFLLEVVKECLEVRAAKVCDGAKASEQATARELLEMPLTNILRGMTMGREGEINR